MLLQVFQKKEAVLGGMDEAIAILKLCSHGFDEPRGAGAVRRRPDRALGDRAHDRGRLHAVLSPRDRLPRRARARARSSRRTCAGSSRRRTGRRSSTSPRGTTTTACRPATAMRRTSRARSASRRTRRPRGGADGDRDRARTGSSPPTAGTPCLAARTFAEWAPEDMNVVVLVDFENDSSGRRSRSPARSAAPVGRAARHLRRPRRPRALGRDGRLRPARRQRASLSTACETPSTRRASRG